MKTIIGGTVAIVITVAIVFAARSDIAGRPFADEVQGQAGAIPSNIAAAGPAAGSVSHDNAVLGYRVTLPDTYRRSRASIAAGQERLGVDTYTSLTPAQERDTCLTDSGSIPSATSAAFLIVEVYRNDAGVSASQWISTRRPAQRATVQPVTVNGLEAARQVEDGKTSGYAIRANGRIYVVSSLIVPSQQALDDIAASFIALQPQAAPAPAATQPPQDAARDLGLQLAAAFQSRDADAVAALTAECAMSVLAIVEPVRPGEASCCILKRAVSPLIEALRVLFTTGALTVVVNPAVQFQAAEGGQYFVRSTWSDSGLTTPIDLFLRETEGQWRWVQAVHHYQAAELTLRCVPYRSPWRAATGASC